MTGFQLDFFHANDYFQVDSMADASGTPANMITWDSVSGKFIKAAYSGGATPNLQQVLDVNNSAIQDINLTGIITTSTLQANGDVFVGKPDGTSGGGLYLNDGIAYSSQIRSGNLTDDRLNQMPDANGVLAVSVNGVTSSTAGDITSTLQTVTDAGNGTNTGIKYIAPGGDFSTISAVDAVNGISIYNDAIGVNLGISLGLLSGDNVLSAPDGTGILPLSVNGNFADASGEITLPDSPTPNLQEVLTAGNTSILDAKINSLFLKDATASAYGSLSVDNNYLIYDPATLNGSQFRLLSDSGFVTTFSDLSINADRNYFLPNESGFLTLSVNGEFADASGEINLDIPGAISLTTITPSEIASYNSGTGVLNIPHIPYFNVQDYGAVGDGVTDNTIAIQNAINDAHVSGGTVYIPHGNYIVSGSLTSYANVSIKGDGVGATTLLSTAAVTMLSIVNTSLIYPDAYPTGSITGIQFYGNTIGTIAIYLQTLVEIIIKDVKIAAFTNTGLVCNGVISGYYERVTITGGINCVKGARTNGINPNLNIFKACQFEFASSYAVLINRGSSWQFEGCDFEFNGVLNDQTTGCINLTNITAQTDKVGIIINGCWFEQNYGILVNAEATVNGWESSVIFENNVVEINTANYNYLTKLSSSNGGVMKGYFRNNGIRAGGSTIDIWVDGSNTTAYVYSGTTYTTNITTSGNIVKEFTALTTTGSSGAATYNNVTGTLNIPVYAGISSLNTLTAGTQTFATGTSGSDFNISSVTSTHTFNIPDAGASARGLVTTSSQTFAGIKTLATPIFTTSARTPLLIGGTGTTSTLTFQTTTGVGATGADFIWNGGNNGATEFMRITNAGDIGFGTSTPNYTGATKILSVIAPSTAFQGEIAVGALRADADATAYGDFSWINAATTSSEKRIGLLRASTQGSTSNNRGGKYTFFTKKDNALTFNSAMTLDNIGRIGFNGVVSPTAFAHLPAGTATAGTATLKFNSGVDLSSPEAGAWYYNGTRLAFSPSTTIKRILLTNDVAPSNGQIPIGNGTDYTVATPTSTGGTLTITSGLGTLNFETTTAPTISNSFSGVGTATTVFTVTIGSTLANNTYKVNVTPTSSLSAALFYVTNKTTTTFDVTYLAGLTGTVQFDWALFR